MAGLRNFLLFQLGWFACVSGAAHGQRWLGPLVASLVIAIHLFFATARTAEARLIVGVFGGGALLESVLMSSGVYVVPAAVQSPIFGSVLAAPFMAALWALFATTLHGSLHWLAGRYRLAVGLGVLFGPLSYLAGARLGAVTLHPRPLVWAVALAVAWGLAMPLLLVASAPPGRAAPGRG